MRSWLINSENCSGFSDLSAIASGLVGVMMDFDDQSIGSGGDRGPRHRQHLVAPPGPVRRIGNDRQMGKLLHDRNRRDVHRVSRVGFKGADAALAKDDVVVPAGEQIFGRSSSSSIVAAIPRFSSTGFFILPSSRSRLKFCMLRAPT